MLFDVSGTNKPFELSEAPGAWRFIIEDVEPETVQLLQANAQELNIFYFVEHPGQPVQKSWFYDKDTPLIEYNSDSRQCVIQIDSRMNYNNDKV